MLQRATNHQTRFSSALLPKPNRSPARRLRFGKRGKRTEQKNPAQRAGFLNEGDFAPIWQREKDSNPHIQSQSLLCYPYTIPLSCALNRHKNYYNERSEIVKWKMKNFQKSFPGAPPSGKLFALSSCLRLFLLFMEAQLGLRAAEDALNIAPVLPDDQAPTDN